MEEFGYEDVCYVATSGEVPPPFDKETMEKLHIEAKRAENVSRHKFEAEKQVCKTSEEQTRQDRINKIKDHAKTKVKEQEEHFLSKSIPGSIEDAQLHINNKTTSANDSAHGITANGLHSTSGELKDAEQQQQPIAHNTAKARQDALNEFSALKIMHSRAHGPRNSTIPVSKAISAGDEEFARQQAELNMIDAELRRSIEELFGNQDLEQALSHNSNHDEPQNARMREGTEKIYRQPKDFLDRASQSTLKKSEGVDEAYRIRQRELDHSFRALLNDDEY